MLVEAVFADGSGPAKVYVRGEDGEALTQSKLEALCASGQIGDLLEAESVPVMEKLQRLIAAERELVFILADGDEPAPAQQSQAANPNEEGPASVGSSWVSTTFHAGACAMCLKHDTKLQRCTGCKHVFLCSNECLKKYWPRHKLLCKALSKATKEDASMAADTQLGSRDAWEAFVAKKQAAVQKHLRRLLDVYETDVLWKQKTCEACWRVNADGLQQCTECRSSWYCSEHEGQFLTAHNAPLLAPEGPESSSAAHPRYSASQCSALKNDLEASQVLLECSGNVFWMPPSAAAGACESADPSTDAAAPKTALPEQGWEQWLNDRDCPGFVTGFLLPVTLELSYPLTLAHALALSQVVPSSPSQLTVHVLGAEPGPELTHAIKFEEVLHTHPSVSSLHITFVGPALAALPSTLLSAPSALSLCDRCKEHNRSCTLLRLPLLYKDWRSTSGAGWSKPDMVVAFNARCWDLGSGDVPAPDTWGEDLDFLLSEHVPLVISGSSPEETRFDLELLEGMGARLVAPLQENPWASLWWRPRPSTGAGAFEAENLSLFAVRGRA